jgi:2-octaprenyl-6-methoxyphenol hydroxylase
MNKQKICIIGGGLTSLITAVTLSKLNLDIDLVSKNFHKIKTTCRTTAISHQNFEFIKKLKFFKHPEKYFWSCSNMKLYTEEKNKISEIFEINSTNTKNNKVFYMIENSQLVKALNKKISETKLIKLIKKNKTSEIINIDLLKGFKFQKELSSKYNLIILCTGNNSQLINNFVQDKTYEYDYEEFAITTILKHQHLKNNIARQFFLNEGVLAFLPISNSKTSVVWSINKKFMKNNNNVIKKKIEFYAKNFFKKIKFISNFEKKELNLLIRNKYYSERVLLFGDAIHLVHPLAGQGTNMTLRDLNVLTEILKNKINLGLDIGSDDVLSEFANITKSKNFAYSLGIDLIRKSFKFQKKPLKSIRNKIMIQINKNNIAKNIFYNIANKGLKL